MLARPNTVHSNLELKGCDGLLLDIIEPTHPSIIVEGISWVPETKDMNTLALHTVCEYDLEKEQEEMMSQTLSSMSSTSQQDKTTRAHNLETAIKMRKEHKLETMPSPQRARFSASPSQNASRFCKKPKERASSEGGTPLHSMNGNHTIRIESPCQVSVTSLNANIRLPMDRLSSKLFNPPERSYTSLGASSPRRAQNGGSCFGCRGRTARQYVIHPDWVSENLSIGKAQLSNRGNSDVTDYMKRSQSCPPPMRNVITWDNKYLTTSRQINGNDR